jgi:hypothetical protein
MHGGGLAAIAAAHLVADHGPQHAADHGALARGFALRQDRLDLAHFAQLAARRGGSGRSHLGLHQRRVRMRLLIQRRLRQWIDGLRRRGRLRDHGGRLGRRRVAGTAGRQQQAGGERADQPGKAESAEIGISGT